MTRPLECRSSPGLVALRADPGRGATIAGYAAKFGKRSRDLGGFVEMVSPTAFNRSRGNGWPGVLARFEHTELLGTSAARTLRLEIDGTGLAYEVEPPRSRADVVELVERGDVRYSSFAFRTQQDEWSVTDQGFPLRTLISVELVDVAPVVSPAYPDATAGLRSLSETAGVSLEEVRALAADNRLRELLVRSSAGGRTLGTTARAALIGRDRPCTSGAAALAAIRTRE